MKYKENRMCLDFYYKICANIIRFASVTAIALSLIFSLISNSTQAADKPTVKPETSDINSDAKRAKEMLERAVSYYQEKQDMALAAFTRQSEFTQEDLYVYVINTKGVMLASGGSSAALIGRDVSAMRDAEGKLFFQEILNTAKSNGSGTVEYRWLNRLDRKIERKITYFQKVGELIIAVGYYIPHASADQAKAMLNRASDAVKNNAKSAFKSFGDLNGKFIEDDLYVFVIGIEDMHFRAHGANPRLVNTDAKTLTDPNGKPIIQMMITMIKSKGQGELEYSWRNPVTSKIEKKHTFVRKVGNYLVGVGYYIR